MTTTPNHTAQQLQAQISAMGAIVLLKRVVPLISYDPSADMLRLFWQVNEARSHEHITEEEHDLLNSELDLWLERA